MKPKNFPERKRWRKLRAKARAEGRLTPIPPPYVEDMRFRLGRQAREAIVPVVLWKH